MHSRTLRACALAWLSVAAAATQAQAEPPSQDPVEYQFDDDKVSGDLVAPLGEVLSVRGKGDKQSLVRARRSFIDKLLRAVENL